MLGWLLSAPMNIKKSIGNRIRQARAKLGLTQEQLAKELHTSKSSISDWEIGDNLPKIPGAIELAQKAEVSLDWLLTGSENDSNNPKEHDITPEEQRLLNAFRMLNRIDQAAVIRIIEAMKK